MKQLAVVLAAVLSLALVAPALAQPFADVPTDHWAYDAIAELAAKGLVEGYPDGAFRGDRAITRYEMAMVVARLLARIEAIKIPPLPPDLVRRAELAKTDAATRAALTAVDKRLTAKLATIQRLVAEFRAELAALGVRVTAVEEELAALRGRLDNVKVTGDMRYRYNVYPSNTPSGGGTVRSPDARLRGRLTFTSQPTANPNVTAVIRIRADNTPTSTGGTADTRFGNTLTFQSVAFDLMYLDVRNTWGANLWRIGRQAYSIAPYGFGGGLLFDPGNSAGAVIGFTSGMIDGLRSDWVFGPINLEVGLWRDNLLNACPTTAPTPPVIGGLCTSNMYWDYKTVRATTTALLPGWTLGGTYYDQGQFQPVNPLVFYDVGRGWGFDLNGTLMPGISLYVDWATYTARLENTASTLFTYPAATAWRVGGQIDLERVAGITTWSPKFDWAYQNYGPMPFSTTTGLATAPFYTYGTTVFGQYFPWNMRGWVGRLSLTFSPRTSFFVHYEGGNVLSSVPGDVEASYYEWWIRLTHRLSTNLTGYIQYTKAHCDKSVTNANCGGSTNPAFLGDLHNFYRAELTYSW